MFIIIKKKDGTPYRENGQIAEFTSIKDAIAKIGTTEELSDVDCVVRKVTRKVA